VLNKGMVAQQGNPMTLYHQPDNEFVATFIGSPKMNIIPMRATRGANGTVHLQSPLGLVLDLPDASMRAPQGDVRLGIRPEHLKIATDDGPGSFSVEVAITERLGVETYLTVGPIDQPLIVRAEGDISLRPGDRVSLTVDASACHLFDQSGQAIRLTNS